MKPSPDLELNILLSLMFFFLQFFFVALLLTVPSTFKTVPVSALYLPISVLVQLTLTPSAVTSQLPLNRGYTFLDNKINTGPQKSCSPRCDKNVQPGYDRPRVPNPSPFYLRCHRVPKPWPFHFVVMEGGGGLKANENDPNLVNNMGSGIKLTGRGEGVSEVKMESMGMDATALLLPQVDVRDMRVSGMTDQCQLGSLPRLNERVLTEWVTPVMRQGHPIFFFLDPRSTCFIWGPPSGEDGGVSVGPGVFFSYTLGYVRVIGVLRA